MNIDTAREFLRYVDKTAIRQEVLSMDSDESANNIIISEADYNQLKDYVFFSLSLQEELEQMRRTKGENELFHERVVRWREERMKMQSMVEAIIAHLVELLRDLQGCA